MLSGALLSVKGVVIILSDADPGLVPSATLLFALGMAGLHARLAGRGGLVRRVLFLGHLASSYPNTLLRQGLSAEGSYWASNGKI
jgi:hypothetical protein